jgi:hypothetical protein
MQPASENAGLKAKIKLINMRTQTYFLAFLMAFVFISCTDEEIIEYPTGTKVVSVENISAQSNVRTVYNFTYNDKGRVSVVNQTLFAPLAVHSVETRTYNNAGLLVDVVFNMNTNLFRTRLTYSNGMIILAERFLGNLMTGYSEYTYTGTQLTKKVDYERVNGHFGIILYAQSTYTYHPDGNLHKHDYLHYQPGSNNTLYILTETWANYALADNPHLKFEILPENKLQKKLPASYHYKSGGAEWSREYENVIDGQGLVRKRTIKQDGIVIEEFHYNYN